jgi:hypothetical protein
MRTFVLNWPDRLHGFQVNPFNMRKEYQIRWNEEIIFRSDSWRTANALLDKCPEDSYIYKDVFYDDEPYKE